MPPDVAAVCQLNDSARAWQLMEAMSAEASAYPLCADSLTQALEKNPKLVQEFGDVDADSWAHMSRNLHGGLRGLSAKPLNSAAEKAETAFIDQAVVKLPPAVWLTMASNMTLPGDGRVLGEQLARSDRKVGPKEDRHVFAAKKLEFIRGMADTMSNSGVVVERDSTGGYFWNSQDIVKQRPAEPALAVGDALQSLRDDPKAYANAVNALSQKGKLVAVVEASIGYTGELQGREIAGEYPSSADKLLRLFTAAFDAGQTSDVARQQMAQAFTDANVNLRAAHAAQPTAAREYKRTGTPPDLSLAWMAELLKSPHSSAIVNRAQPLAHWDGRQTSAALQADRMASMSGAQPGAFSQVAYVLQQFDSSPRFIVSMMDRWHKQGFFNKLADAAFSNQNKSDASTVREMTQTLRRMGPSSAREQLVAALVAQRDKPHPESSAEMILAVGLMTHVLKEAAMYPLYEVEAPLIGPVPKF